jgi:hypothetical protein
MPAIHLNKTHPGLFRAIRSIALTHFGVGSLLLYGSVSVVRTNPALAWGFIGAFYAITAMLVYGLYAPTYRWVRRGLILGLLLITFLSIIFAVSIGATLTESQTIRLAWILPPWLSWSYQHFLCLAEPPENPMAEGKR